MGCKASFALIYYNLIIFLVDMRFPTQFLTFRSEHLKHGKYLWVVMIGDMISPTNLIRICYNTILDS